MSNHAPGGVPSPENPNAKPAPKRQVPDASSSGDQPGKPHHGITDVPEPSNMRPPDKPNPSPQNKPPTHSAEG